MDEHGPVLTHPGLSLDPRRPRPLAFLSHAHAARVLGHQRILATPATAALARAGGELRKTEEVRYGEPCRLGGTLLTLHPAGHMLGSAMLRAERGGDSLLYPGDFKLSPSLTAETAAPPKARVLLLDAPYGSPEFVFPSREMAEAEILSTVHELFASGATPVLLAYSLGTAQEIQALLAREKISVRLAPPVKRFSDVYRQLGAPVGPCDALEGPVPPETAVIASPKSRDSWALSKLVRPKFILVSGKASSREQLRALKADHGAVLSGHAGWDELLDLIGRVQPEEVHVLRGPAAFIAELSARGIGARYAREVKARKTG